MPCSIHLGIFVQLLEMQERLFKERTLKTFIFPC